MATQNARGTGVATLACAALLLPACEAPRCRPTDMDASDATVVDAGAVTSSSVLEARLTARGKGLAGKSVLFHVRVDGRFRFVGSADTGSDGTARVDLKEDALELTDAAAADSYRAVFDGDGKFCSSRDEADLDLVGGP